MSLAAALQAKFPVRRQSSSQQKVARGAAWMGPPPSQVAIVAAGLRGKGLRTQQRRAAATWPCSMHYVHLQN